jgi:hypothetical protein
VLTAPQGSGRPHPAGAGALDAETKKFLAGAVIEGEIRDAQTNTLLAEGIDWRRPGRTAVRDLGGARSCARLLGGPHLRAARGRTGTR